MAPIAMRRPRRRFIFSRQLTALLFREVSYSYPEASGLLQAKRFYQRYTLLHAHSRRPSPTASTSAPTSPWATARWLAHVTRMHVYR